MKEGDQSRTNSAHSAECRARVAEILSDDVEFRTKMKRAEERKEGGHFAQAQEANGNFVLLFFATGIC